MHEKVIPIGSWDFGIAPVEQIKVASAGLKGGDKKSFLEKRAAAPIFADMLGKVKLASGDIPIHAIAIGSTEGYSSNRNGDAFCEKTCKDRHHTFVSKPLDQIKKGEHVGARYYLHHKNKDPKESYGYCKASAYNDDMRRIELLLIANGTKEAAERNGGHVLEDATLEKISKGDTIPFSMACKLAYDVCHICENKAPSRTEYCTDSSCIDKESGERGYGCKKGLCKLTKTGRVQYVENPNCTFFDFSQVIRPADRTAYGVQADYLMKAASADGIIMGGFELAEKFSRDNSISGGSFKLHRLARNLAKVAADLPGAWTVTNKSLALSCLARPELDLIPKLHTTQKQAEFLKMLADREIILPLREFLKVAAPNSTNAQIETIAQVVAPYVPSMYKELIQDTEPDLLFKDSMRLPISSGSATITKLAEAYSFKHEFVWSRACRASLNQQDLPIIKEANHLEPMEEAYKLAKKYANYKLAALALNEAGLGEREFKLAVLQDYLAAL